MALGQCSPRLPSARLHPAEGADASNCLHAHSTHSTPPTTAPLSSPLPILQESLARVRETCTTVIVAHRLSTVMDADLILVFENGSIVEQGKPAGGRLGGPRLAGHRRLCVQPALTFQGGARQPTPAATATIITSEGG